MEFEKGHESDPPSNTRHPLCSAMRRCCKSPNSLPDQATCNGRRKLEPRPFSETKGNPMDSRIPAWAVAAILCLVIQPAAAQDLDINRATLRSLDSIYVAIERLDPDARSQGLDEEGLRAEAEEQLKRAGLVLRTRSEFDLSPEKVILYIRLSTLRRGSCIAYSISVALRQEVVLVRDPGITLVTETWSVGGIGSADPGKLKDVAREAVKTYLDRFIRARRSVADYDPERTIPW